MNTTHTSHQLFLHIAEYMETLQAKEIADWQTRAQYWADKNGAPVVKYETAMLKNVDLYSIDDHPRSKYIRVKKDGTNGQTFVHSFVDRETGSVYKPAGWKSPAKGKDGKPVERYNLLNDESRAKLLDRCESTGGYLYADRAKG
jgi:hypothetical protein